MFQKGGPPGGGGGGRHDPTKPLIPLPGQEEPEEDKPDIVSCLFGGRGYVFVGR